MDAKISVSDNELRDYGIDWEWIIKTYFTFKL